MGSVMMWAGLVLLALAACFWMPKWLWSRSMQHAKATVTQMEARQDAQGNVAYFAHFRFRLPDDELVEVVSAKGSNPPAFSDRQVVPAVYKAGDPRGAVLAPTKQVYKTAIAFGVTGTILFDIGAIVWVKQRQRQIRRIRYGVG